jgi:hypothetical protein
MERAVRSFAQLFARFAARPKVGRKLRLASLWREWPRLFADAPFDLGQPLGGRDRVLVVGVEDPMAMQELSFARLDILERANAFLGEQCFDKVRLELIHGQASLGTTRVFPGAKPPAPVALPRVGGLDLPRDTPIGRCYAKYVALAAGGPGESAPGIRMKENGQ